MNILDINNMISSEVTKWEMYVPPIVNSRLTTQFNPATKSHTVDGNANSDGAAQCSCSSDRVHSKQHQMQFVPDNKYFLFYVVYLFTIALISVSLYVHTVLRQGQ